MNKSMDEIILCRIVANQLYKRIEGIGITMSNDSLYDLKVEEITSGLIFGVKVGDLDYPTSQQYATYLSELEQRSYGFKEERLPIMLMCADKEAETIKFGYQLTWNRYRASIQTKVTLREITPDNWAVMIENLKEMDKVIRMLNDDKISIIKRYFVERKIPTGGVAHAEIIYLRRFTDLYKMKQKEVVTKEERFHRMLTGIPEDEYPNDILDKLIFKGLDQVFPNPQKKSQILLLNTELQDLKRELERSQKSFTISYEPDFCDLTSYHTIINSIRIIRIPLVLYHDPLKMFNDNISDEFTSVTEPLKDWVKNYGLIETLAKETLRNVADVVTIIE